MQQPTQDWSKIRERGSSSLLMVVLYFYRLGGRWLCRKLMLIVIAWYWLFAVTARQASLAYLRQLHQFAGTRSPFISAPSWLHSYRHFMNFGECILDKMEGWLGDVSEQKLKLFGDQHFREAYQKGTLMVVSHFGNIELFRAIKAEHPQKVTILVYQKNATEFNRFLKRLNDQVDVNLISVDELGLETAILLEEKLKQGEWVIIAADRTPVDSDRVQHLAFLGREATWPQGAWILASLLKVPVLAVFCYRHQQQFEVHVHKIADVVNLPRKDRLHAMQQVTGRYVALLEQHCLRAPYQWFNFYHFWNK
ncbi:acyltransferase [Acinetobacter sp. ACZLY 512]|uniref:LpxL/LpxP family acyltransferase n=1 Tax=Acinetobacter sp. ACZLY 512 TaxID=2911206 RepID=UPI0020261F64|nr:acyltransferase [Acinetobacter sp. ACZLY 512]MCL9675667.1 acyltransferase [Acinetobacter sp. ACZLY 512]